MNGGLSGNIPNGTTDYIWSGWQTMEERNPFGGSGSTDTPTKQYIWGTYIDECVQLNLLVAAGPQSAPAGAYYLLQDLLYRAVALVNSSGQVVEAYDTDAYGKTLIFTGPGGGGQWFTDYDAQSDYGANNLIYCGYYFDAETQLYYVRNRTYNPVLGRWIQRDPIGYAGGINLYGYVGGWAPRLTDASGEGFWTWVGVGVAIGLIAGLVVASQIVPGVDVIVTAAGTVAIAGLVDTATGLAVGAAVGAGSGALAGGAAHALSHAVDDATDCDEDSPGRCNPCIPPAGSIASDRVDLPPSKPHAGIPTPHTHILIMNQSPYPTCRCFWNRPRPPDDVFAGIVPLPPPAPPLGGGGGGLTPPSQGTLPPHFGLDSVLDGGAMLGYCRPN